MNSLKQKMITLVILFVILISSVACDVGDQEITVDGHTTTPNELIDYNVENNSNVMSPLNAVWSD